MKKILATILGILLLFFMALYLPSFVLQYQDFQDANQIHYRKSPDISIYKSKENNENMLSRLNSLFDNELNPEPQLIVLSYELSLVQQQQLLANVTKELDNYISTLQLESLYEILDLDSKKTLTRYEMHTIYGEDISFLKLWISLNDTYQNHLTLYVHPDSYKIYYLVIENSYLSSYPLEKLYSMHDHYDSTNYDTAAYGYADYSIYERGIALSNYYQTDLNIWYEIIEGAFLAWHIEHLHWNISVPLKQAKYPYLVIGISEIEDFQVKTLQK